jgi:arylsulfatase A-like enzyme
MASPPAVGGVTEVSNVLLVTIDSLRRDFCGAYYDRPLVTDYDVETEALDRFAQRATVFDAHWAGSLPCMPQRREFLAGVREFLWRPWGPAEPFDDLVPALAREAGVLPYLVTDHYHYFEEGGEGYWTDYTGFEFVRGHERDAWRTTPRVPDADLLAQSGYGPADAETVGRTNVQYSRNVDAFDPEDETDFFAARTFSTAADWLRDNGHAWDRWFCYVDSFDVHEPFHNPEPYASMYTDEDPRDPDLRMWPEYASVADQEMDDRELEFVRSQFAGKVTMTDRWFGRVLDALDEEGLWDDTMVVVTTDHGYALGDHGHLAKNHQPTYDEIARTPLFVHHPDAERDRVGGLTSAVDVYPTLLDAMGIDPPNCHGRSLLPLLTGERDAANHREYALYGYFGAGVNVTDGRYTYLHPPADLDAPLYRYATKYDGSRYDGDDRDPSEIEAASLPHTGMPVWRMPAEGRTQNEDPLLFDVSEDPRQTDDLVASRPEERERMRELLRRGMDDLDAPDEQYERLGLA